MTWQHFFFFFETKYILIENRIQNNSFQKTEIFHPFSRNSNLLYPQSTVLYVRVHNLFHKVFIKPLLYCRRWEQMIEGEKDIEKATPLNQWAFGNLTFSNSVFWHITSNHFHFFATICPFRRENCSQMCSHEETLPLPPSPPEPRTFSNEPIYSLLGLCHCGWKRCLHDFQLLKFRETNFMA